jgi:hypothetical protein
MATQPDDREQQGTRTQVILRKAQAYSATNGYPALIAAAVGMAVFAGQSVTAIPFALFTYLAVRKSK